MCQQKHVFLTFLLSDAGTVEIFSLRNVIFGLSLVGRSIYETVLSYKRPRMCLCVSKSQCAVDIFAILCRCTLCVLILLYVQLLSMDRHFSISGYSLE